MKRFFALLALTATVVLAGCSDDETPAWKELPNTPITGADATLSVNGTAAEGSAQLTTRSATEGTLTLTDMIPGYAEIAVPVTLSENADNSFGFTGTTELTTPPAMLPSGTLPFAAAPGNPGSPIYNIAVRGQLSKEGKIAVAATQELTQAAQGGVAGSWEFAKKIDMADETLLSSHLWLTWSALDPAQLNFEAGAYTLNVFGSGLLYNLLGQVDFLADGNITARYSQMEFSMETVTGAIFGSMSDDGFWQIAEGNDLWADSPKNLAYWYTKDGLLYIVPNITAIMKQAGADNGGESAGTGSMEEVLAMLKELGIDVTPLLPTVMQWLQTGIPVKYAQSADGLKITIDKEMAAPFIEALLPATKTLDELLEAIISDPENENAMLIKMALAMFGIEKPSDLKTIWETNTKEFGIALTFQPKGATAASVKPEAATRKVALFEQMKRQYAASRK